MLKLFKIIIINILIFFVFILLIEVIFGYWFDKDNLGPYVREHRLRKVNYEVTYEGTQYSFTYERNYYGFRGKDVPLDNIKGVIVGGSTTDERYKPEEFTITELINSYLKNKNINFKLYNAGIEGQSTRGHAVNIDYWFKKLPNFKPNFIFYYIGINDQWVTSDVPAIRDGKILSLDKKEVFFDNLKSRSVTYDLLRKAKHIFYSSDKRLLYDFDKDLEKKSATSLKQQMYYRRALRDWCQLISYSGLRTGEASLLKWKDWKIVNEGQKNEHCILDVRGEEKKASKTGARQVIGLKFVNTCLTRRKADTTLNKPDDYIFSHIVFY